MHLIFMKFHILANLEVFNPLNYGNTLQIYQISLDHVTIIYVYYTDKTNTIKKTV